MRKHNPKEINLEIKDIEIWENANYEGFDISWISTIGFGKYRIYRKTGTDEWCADSETMDINEDKSFIKELMRLFIEKIIINY